MDSRTIDDELRLVPYYRNDEVSLAWYQDPDVCRQVDNIDHVYDLERLHRMYDYLCANGDCFYIEYQGTLVGDVSLRNSSEIAIVICREYQNRHIGRRCIKEILKLAREKGMDSVKANIYSFNEQSRRMFKAAGFVKTGEEWYEYRRDPQMKIYVDAKAGRDGNGTAERPYKRISDAARAAQPGDEVIVRPGIYREYVDPKHAGTAEARITYRSEQPLGAEITGAELLTGWEPYQGTVWTASVDNGIFGAYNPYTTYVYGDWYFAGRSKHTGCVYLNDKMLYEAESIEVCLVAEKSEHNGVATQFLGADKTADRQIIINLHVFGSAEFGDNFRNIETAAVNGDNRILLIHTGHGNEGITILNTFSFQHMDTRSIAINDGYIIEVLGKFFTAHGVFFNDFDIEIILFQDAG